MKATLDAGFLDGAQREIERAGVDGWLLYDLEGRNRIAGEILGLPDGISRRYFVLLRPGRAPQALAHAIELTHWTDWPGEVRSYVGWEDLETALSELLEGCGTVAMETSERDAVPFVDNVPAGVLELITALGVRVVSSAGLLSRTYAQWGEDGLILHRKAAAILAETAEAAYRRGLEAVLGGVPMTEYDLASWIESEVASRGLLSDGVIVGVGPNSANPHYWPQKGTSASLEASAVLLIDLWGRVEGEPRAVFADQTWMGVLGPEAPEGFGAAWDAVRDARDGAVEFIAGGYANGAGPTGAEVDAEARRILSERGFGDHILHRTGHAMDRVNHGFGPNLDSVETRDARRLVRGIGFSVEPGIYLAGRWGIRSEINVHLGEEGPEVSPPAAQREPWLADG
ncbi:MAG: M24 family metallopeptidase [Gemmatimonadota bacterium]